MDDHQFRQLLNRFDFSWSGYRKIRKGVKKRIHRHMMALGCLTISDYLAEMGNNEEVRHQCELLLTVSISRFFRDVKFWKTLENEWLPEMIKKNNNSVKIWSAGCASGEEVYSFKIIWDCVTTSVFGLPKLEIIGTDINPIYLDRARVGVYSASSLKEVPEAIKYKYFQQEPGKNLYRVRSNLRKDIRWGKHHLLSDSPGSDFDIIFLRNNVLTYYKDRLKSNAFNNVLAGLSPGGLLIIGSHESVPFESSELVCVAPFAYVFRKAPR